MKLDQLSQMLRGHLQFLSKEHLPTHWLDLVQKRSMQRQKKSCSIVPTYSTLLRILSFFMMKAITLFPSETLQAAEIAPIRSNFLLSRTSTMMWIEQNFNTLLLLKKPLCTHYQSAHSEVRNVEWHGMLAKRNHQNLLPRGTVSACCAIVFVERGVHRRLKAGSARRAPPPRTAVPVAAGPTAPTENTVCDQYL